MLEKKGSKGGAVVRAFASHQCGPGLIRSVDAICGLSLLFVFLRVLRFPLSSKTNTSKFQFDQESGRRGTIMWMCYLQIVIYFILKVLSHVRFRRIDVQCKDTTKDSYENNLYIELFVGKNENCPV